MSSKSSQTIIDEPMTPTLQGHTLIEYNNTEIVNEKQGH